MSGRGWVVAAVILILVVVGAVVAYGQVTALSYAGVRDALRAHGADVREVGLGSQPFLTGTDHRLVVDGESVDVFEYATTLGADYDAGRVAADGTTIRPGFGPFGGQGAVIDFVAPPHWFHRGRAIVLYVGRANDVLARLRRVLGGPFAGPVAAGAMAGGACEGSE